MKRTKAISKLREGGDKVAGRDGRAGGNAVAKSAVVSTLSAATGLDRVVQWFAASGREPFAFQRETWAAYLAGRDGLIQAPTGAGKTLAAAIGPMIEWIDATSAVQELRSADRGGVAARRASSAAAPPLAILWITPLRALAADTVQSIQAVLDGLGLSWSVELRTSDTSASIRKRQKDRLPTVLVTTPESLSLLISYPESAQKFSTLKCVVVDEWHELIGSKRGVQTELGLARLRTFAPAVRTWGVSATISNADEAASALLGPGRSPAAAMIRAPDDKPIEVESLLPEKIERFPWAGHIGTRMTADVAKQIDRAGTTLVFANTRAQAEIWFAALLAERPDWLGKLAIHHGSIDRKLRNSVEDMLRTGQLRAAVCTSSLDLGVDFWPVEQVIQIGSPKGVARAMQRAGRSGHRPGAVSKIICVPTQAFETVEFSATRLAIGRRMIERREPVRLALDVLAQHSVTVAAGDGFVEAELFEEVRQTHAFSEMTAEQWGWVMDFVRRGGPTLTAYPRFMRVIERDGRWIIASDALAKMHRMSIGTITADGAVNVQYVTGKFLGTVEESFAARLKPGDLFFFSGRMLELVRVHEMTAQVRAAKAKKGAVPRWNGGKMPMSTSLAEAVRIRLEEAAAGEFVDEEMRRVRPILDLQARWSHIPFGQDLLIETAVTREGCHHFLFPLQGRLAHEGLAALLMHRFARRAGAEAAKAVNGGANSDAARASDRAIFDNRPRSDVGASSDGDQGSSDRAAGSEGRPAAAVPISFGPSANSRLMSNRGPKPARGGNPANRLTGRVGPAPITATFNDYGLELLSPTMLASTEAEWLEMMSVDRLAEDVLECVNSGELARRHFREIARIAGLLVPVRPGAQRSVRQLQASSELFFDVFREFDPQNLLLEQARREVLERQLEFSRLKSALQRIAGQRLVLKSTARITPLAFPLFAESLASQTLRSETARQRIERLAAQLELEADAEDNAIGIEGAGEA
jgi:ATP-dependent Lhr-like helicase